jgi:hypothetical protein
LRDFEEHSARARILSQLSVDLTRELELVGVRDTGFGDEGSDGTGRVESFPNLPRVALRNGLFLKGRHIIS